MSDPISTQGFSQLSPPLQLPQEIQVEILSHADLPEIGRMAQVNKSWRQATLLEDLWRRKCRNTQPAIEALKKISSSWKDFFYFKYNLLHDKHQLRRIAKLAPPISLHHLFGNYIAVNQANFSSILIWDIPSATKMCTLKAPKGLISALANYADSLVGATDSGHIYIWDVETKAILKEINLRKHVSYACENDHATTLKVYKNRLLVGTQQGAVLSFDLKRDSPALILKDPTKSVETIAAMAIRNNILSVYENKKCRIYSWNLSSKTLIRECGIPKSEETQRIFAIDVIKDRFIYTSQPTHRGVGVYDINSPIKNILPFQKANFRHLDPTKDSYSMQILSIPLASLTPNQEGTVEVMATIAKYDRRIDFWSLDDPQKLLFTLRPADTPSQHYFVLCSLKSFDHLLVIAYAAVNDRTLYEAHLQIWNLMNKSPLYAKELYQFLYLDQGKIEFQDEKIIIQTSSFVKIISFTPFP